MNREIKIKTGILHVTYDSSLSGKIQCEVPLSGSENLTAICSTKSLLEVYHILNNFLKEIKNVIKYQAPKEYEDLENKIK